MKDHQDDGVAANRTTGGMATVTVDPLATARLLFDALGPSMSVALVAELSRLVAAAEPTLVPPVRFLVMAVLS